MLTEEDDQKCFKEYHCFLRDQGKILTITLQQYWVEMGGEW